MNLPVEILENIFIYTDTLTIYLFQLETNLLSKYFCEKYTNYDKLYKCLDKKLKYINNSDLYILLSKLPKNLQQYCVNNANYNDFNFNYIDNNELDLIKCDLHTFPFYSNELSSNMKEIIEREKNNVDIYSSNIEAIFIERNIKESKNISKIDFKDKHIEYKPINFMEIKKQYF